jgi:hypothetical protein
MMPSTSAFSSTVGRPCRSTRRASSATISVGTPAGDESVNRLAIAHELRTPLNAILGNVELLLDGSTGPLSAEARGCLNDVQLGARRMLRYVEVLQTAVTTAAVAAEMPGRVVDPVALLRRGCTARAWRLVVTPRGARCPIHGGTLWGRALTSALLETAAADLASRVRPALRLDSWADASDRGFRLSWPGFRADAVTVLDLQLLAAIVGGCGATVRPTARGLSLHWPAGPVDE